MDFPYAKPEDSRNKISFQTIRIQQSFTLRVNPAPKANSNWSNAKTGNVDKPLKTYKLPASIFNELTKQNFSELNLLQISRDEDQIGWDLCSNFKSSLALKNLPLQFYSKPELDLLFKSLGRWSWEILYLDYAETAEFIEWSKIFKFVEKNSTTKSPTLWLTFLLQKRKDK